MTDLRTAAQQALEAMRRAVPTGKITLYEWDKALSDLDAALAEQRLTEVQQEMERSIESLKAALAQEQAGPICKCDLRTRLVGDGCEVCNPELAAELAQEQAEPVQEPAYKVKIAGRWHEAEPFAAAFSLPDGEHLLYTAPPKRKPLTEEEIDRITDQQWGAANGQMVLYAAFRTYARAIERAHGIGGQDGR